MVMPSFWRDDVNKIDAQAKRRMWAIMCGPARRKSLRVGEIDATPDKRLMHGLYDVYSQIMRWSPVLIEWDDDIDTKQPLGLSNRFLAYSIKTHPLVV